MANWYCSPTAYNSVAQWAASTAVTVGLIRRQLAAPATGSERCFRCTTAGTTGASEPTWVLTKGATTADGTAVWTEITGQAIYNGDGGGTLLGAPFARLYPVLGTTGWVAAGDVVFCDATSGETWTTAVAYQTLAVSVSVLSASLTSVPPTAVTSGYSITTTGATALTYGTTATAPLYTNGLVFNCGTGTTAATLALSYNGGTARYENCAYNLLTTAGAGAVQLSGLAVGECSHLNCTVTFAATTQTISLVGGGALWYEGGSIAATGTVPTTLLGIAAYANALFDGVNLSAVNTTLTSTTSNTSGAIEFVRCPINASLVLPSFTTWQGGKFRLIDCSSTGTNLSYRSTHGPGLTTQSTAVYRNSGTTLGTPSGTPFSLSMVSAATASFYNPFGWEWYATGWNTLTGASHTVTFFLASATASLTNAQVWIDLEYFGTSGSALASITSSRAAPLATPAALTTDGSSTWGGSPANLYKIAFPITPQIAGILRWRPRVGAASTTVYFDPTPVIV